MPEDAGDELARRFAARAGAVDDQQGFEGFELLRPTDDRRQWLVVTRWRDEECKAVDGHVYLEKVEDDRGNRFFVLFQVVSVDEKSRYVAFLWRQLPGGKVVRRH